MKWFLIECINFILNHIVIHIPLMWMRKFFYRLCGMKIGSKTKILMGVTIYAPWNICIGKRCVINENCLLDGRGGISIGDDCSISFRTSLITGTHNIHSKMFEYQCEEIKIENCVWICSNVCILPGVKIENLVVISAGSVVKRGNYDSCLIFAGNPAKEIGKRKCDTLYQQQKWKMFLR